MKRKNKGLEITIDDVMREGYSFLCLSLSLKNVWLGDDLTGIRLVQSSSFDWSG